MHKTQMPLHSMSREVLRGILEHMPEKKRVQVLLTCKDFSKLLTERQTAAQVAFEGLAEELANGHNKDSKWSREKENHIVYSEMYYSTRGNRNIDFGVCLEDSGIVRIVVRANFRDATCRNHGGPSDVHEFYPWMRMACLHCKEDTKDIDDDTGVIFGALMRSSPFMH